MNAVISYLTFTKLLHEARSQDIMKHVCIIIRFNILGLQTHYNFGSLQAGQQYIIDENENRVEFPQERKYALMLSSSKIGRCDVRCKLAIELFGTLHFTLNY